MEEPTDSTLCRLPKRQKTCHGGSLTLDYDHYNVAWICALFFELAAARAMLDEVHRALPTHTDDSNTYVLGKVGGHNVIIACLPDDQYGTNNATNVVTNMRRTFSAIRVGFMIGVGGGVPGKNELRLGDVVVGTRVMQYDLGKIGQDGKLYRTAVPRIPHQLLRTAISALRSKHELEPSGVQSILQQRLGIPAYRRPDSPDRLFHASYSHHDSAASCDACDQSRLVPRSSRMYDVMIHYGAIASGNQVMKDGTTRDNVARELDVICFEMEAAGLMDVLPCLPIRGICDYSDSHKSKEWQRYAAATAAAYARELLEELPATKADTGLVSTSNAVVDQSPQQENRKILLGYLRFAQIDSRKQTIKAAHKKTCQWFLRHRDYESWLNPANLSQHHGFLWVSGKPGAGKSTIMKYAYSMMKKKDHRNTALTASFFFNARGDSLEKSIEGMYRSLLLQLLEGYPDLQTVMDDPELIPQSRDCPCVSALEELLRNAISALGQRSFTCFIDALDECDEQQIVSMTDYFAELTEQSMVNGVLFRVCFSSRHYPYIKIKRGIRLTLEDQPGHAIDLEVYIASRLSIEDSIKELETQVLEKAAGVFMWVVLVVDILNKESRRGGMAMKKRLAEIPSDLSELFKDILRRDTENMETLLLCVLWILSAKRPLQPAEFYHALWSGLSEKQEGLVDETVPATDSSTASTNLEKFHRYVISSSKGLAETTKAKQPTVQFIHESVRDFLIKDKGLYELWPEIGSNWEALSHEKLKKCCSWYMSHVSVRSTVIDSTRPSFYGMKDKEQLRLKMSSNFPFLEYACQQVLYHANSAARVVPQDEFLSSFNRHDWISIHNIFERFKAREYNEDACLFYVLADQGFTELIHTRLREDTEVHIRGGRDRYPLFAAFANCHKDAAAALLGLPSRFHDGSDITQGLNRRKDFKDYRGRTPLSWASQEGREGIVRLLLQAGVSVNEEDGQRRTALSRASEKGFSIVARLLIDNGADVNMEILTEGTPLLLALRGGHEVLAKLLIDGGADANQWSALRETPLVLALRGGYEALVNLLIDRGADVNKESSRDPVVTPLLQVSVEGHMAFANLLIDKGADVNKQSSRGESPLQWASRGGHTDLAKHLIDRGADVNMESPIGETALSYALTGGDRALIHLLIDRGADVNKRNSLGQTPLLRALKGDDRTLASLLVDRGADVNKEGTFGETPLLASLRGGFEALLNGSIDRVADVNQQNFYGGKPLISVLRENYEAVTKLLVARGADVNKANSVGETPLWLAVKGGSETLVKLLIDRGALTGVESAGN